MMKDERVVERICPECGNVYTGYPALSRKDNCTEICPDCGVCQALEAMGVYDDETEKIISEICENWGGERKDHGDA